MNTTLEFLDPRAEREAALSLWRDLAAEAAPRSYFLSPGWVETWLDHLPADFDVRLAVVRQGGDAIAAAFLGHGRVVRQRVFRSDAWLLNQTGQWSVDQVYIEDNDFLCRPGGVFSINELLTQLPGNWDELYLSGVDPNMLERVGKPFDIFVMNRIPAPYVDLTRKDYPAALGSNTRSQIRRCYKLYEQRGPLQTEIAADPAQAVDIFEELVRLHQHSWCSRGKRGAFANPWFYKFHRALVERRFASGEIQLVRVRCGDQTIGCIYNFVWNGSVFFYQSGFRPEHDNKLKPGYVCHTEAIRHSAAAGLAVYDFMASYDEYKVRMSTGQRDLVWARVQKPRLKFAVERVARAGALRAIKRWERRPPLKWSGVLPLKSFAFDRKPITLIGPKP
jgi:CelD/BcsL family acetyltransferase involved in cellulose biosynthesis